MKETCCYNIANDKALIKSGILDASGNLADGRDRSSVGMANIWEGHDKEAKSLRTFMKQAIAECMENK